MTGLPGALPPPKAQLRATFHAKFDRRAFTYPFFLLHPSPLDRAFKRLRYSAHRDGNNQVADPNPSEDFKHGKGLALQSYRLVHEIAPGNHGQNRCILDQPYPLVCEWWKSIHHSLGQDNVAHYLG